MTIRAMPSESPVPSPCNSVCVIDQVTGFCAGCFRTLDEIAAWSLLDDTEKRRVWAALAQRCVDAAPAALGTSRNGNGDNGER